MTDVRTKEDIQSVPIKTMALIKASQVKMTPTTWLWGGFIPFGKATDLQSTMGVGKTTLAMATAAAVTTGGALPGQDSTARGDVVIISLEDDASDTLVPRLKAAGANLDRCHIFTGFEYDGRHVDGGLDLAADLPKLRAAIKATGAILVVIDPLMGALGSGVNSHKDQEVRSVVMAPLAQIAAETGAAVLLIRHFRKGASSAEDAGGGSVGIAAACRSVLRVDRDPEDDERFLLSCVKSSLAKRPQTIGYRIEGVTLAGDPEIETCRTKWDGTSDLSAFDLAALSGSVGDEHARGAEAREWLRAALEGGGKHTSELFKAADKEGIVRRTLQRVADSMGVIKVRRGFGEGSVWSLPNPIHDTDTPLATPKTVSPMAGNVTNGGGETDTCTTCGKTYRHVLKEGKCTACRRITSTAYTEAA